MSGCADERRARRDQTGQGQRVRRRGAIGPNGRHAPNVNGTKGDGVAKDRTSARTKATAPR